MTMRCSALHPLHSLHPFDQTLWRFHARLLHARSGMTILTPGTFSCRATRPFVKGWRSFWVRTIPSSFPRSRTAPLSWGEAAFFFKQHGEKP